MVLFFNSSFHNSSQHKSCIQTVPSLFLQLYFLAFHPVLSEQSLPLSSWCWLFCACCIPPHRFSLGSLGILTLSFVWHLPCVVNWISQVCDFTAEVQRGNKFSTLLIKPKQDCCYNFPLKASPKLRPLKASAPITPLDSPSPPRSARGTPSPLWSGTSCLRQGFPSTGTGCHQSPPLWTGCLASASLFSHLRFVFYYFLIE